MVPSPFAPATRATGLLVLLILLTMPAGATGQEARAHWIDRTTIAWDAPASVEQIELWAPSSPDATTEAVHGMRPALRLAAREGGLNDAQRKRFPHLAKQRAFALPELEEPKLRALLQGPLSVRVIDPEGNETATGLQIAGILDDLYAWDGPLGPSYDADRAPTLRLWAPTARSVRLLRFADAAAAEPLAEDVLRQVPGTGTWEIAGEPGWYGQYYLFAVEVWAPETGRLEKNHVTDPYSLALAPDSARSQFLALDDPATQPPGWDAQPRRAAGVPEDMVLYELHVRDFSIRDETVPADERGTYLAFARQGGAGMGHLRKLAEAGVSHVHLLPVFDIASVPERREAQSRLAEKALAAMPADGTAQQAAVERIRARDGFNWGYDPWHYTVPEGSYARDADGAARLREFRAMVLALNEVGLKVVMDVVYNHTHASGQDPWSVLDRIVPGYYQRLEDDGRVATSTCCANTATEHRMMERLMIDSVLTWARHYRIDGFRFDLMGHHSKENMTRLRAALDALTVETDGVDGRSIYLYGEGWNFGEVANDARFVQARQHQLAGTGIGSFSDRLRDAARGGFYDSDPRVQGFLNGLHVDPSDWERTDEGDDRARLLATTDWIRLGLAGDLAVYPITRADGSVRRGDEIDYNGSPAGYTADPEENITYVAAHDNETLFDANQLKLPRAATMDDRVLAQGLGNALVLLGQGVPFIHAGQEFLRSKSLDRNSYDAGDWYNAIDWSFETDNWGRGLPLRQENVEAWPLMAPLLADPKLAPGRDDRLAALEDFLALLEIRRSSPLFRLRTADAILERLRFHNMGAEQVPGLVALSLDDADGAIGGPWRRIVVLFNARPETTNFTIDDLAGHRFELHPAQGRETRRDWGSGHARTTSAGDFRAPARSAAVWVQTGDR